MTISETIDGQVAITAQGVTIILNSGDAFELLCWLDERKQQLYRASQHPGEEERLHILMQERMNEQVAQLERNPWERIADHIVTRSDKAEYETALREGGFFICFPEQDRGGRDEH